MSTGGAGLVPVRISNTSDKAQIMSAQTVVFVAKPVTSVAHCNFQGVIITPLVGLI